jgi:DNA-binding response OmpR family regulator
MDFPPRHLVLVVEDDPDLQRAMVFELERMNFEVLGALHYEAAVHQLESTSRPRLVCVDIGLPTRSGYELCEYIRGAMRASRVPILVTSETAMPEDLACAEEAGATAFLKKPFSMRDFSSHVRELLDRSPPSSQPASLAGASFTTTARTR